MEINIVEILKGSFGRYGAGSKPLPEFEPLGVQFADRLNWQLGAEASLPLFQGAERWARKSEAQRRVEEITLQREAVRLRVEELIRSVLHLTGASFTGIDLTRSAAEAADRNLELVTEQYAEGVVDILRLLDAQNNGLVADLVAANAIFDYLTDLMAVQRAVGRFDYYRSPEERQEFLRRLDTSFVEQGVAIRRR